MAEHGRKALIGILTLILSLFPVCPGGMAWAATGDCESVMGKTDTAITSIMGKTGSGIATIMGKNYTDGDTVSITCTGDFSGSPGHYESFEKGTDQFCDTGSRLSQVDNSGAIDTYSTGWAAGGDHCGSYSASIRQDSDDGDNDAIRITLASADDAFSFRYYVKTAEIPTDNRGSLGFPHFTADPDPGGYHKSVSVRIADASTGGTGLDVYLNGGAGDSTYKFVVTEGDSLMIDMKVACNSGTTYMKVFRWNGSSYAAVASTQGAGNYEISTTAAAYSCSYIVFADYTTDNQAYTFYLDDVVIDLGATDYIGAQTCN